MEPGLFSPMCDKVQLIKKIQNTESCFITICWEYIQLVVHTLLHLCSTIQPPKTQFERKHPMSSMDFWLILAVKLTFVFLWLVSNFFLPFQSFLLCTLQSCINIFCILSMVKWLLMALWPFAIISSTSHILICSSLLSTFQIFAL